jgi:hypothetical protein
MKGGFWLHVMQLQKGLQLMKILAYWVAHNMVLKSIAKAYIDCRDESTIGK